MAPALFLWTEIMKVKVEYHDTESFLVEEVIRQAKDNYGKTAIVSVLPESDTPVDFLYFAIQRLITGKHLTLLYDSKELYQKDLEVLRNETMYKIGEVLNDVIIDNENKLT